MTEAVDVVAAGLTGFDDSSETAHAIAEGIRSMVRAERVVVTNDAVTSYLGAVGFELTAYSMRKISCSNLSRSM